MLKEKTEYFSCKLGQSNFIATDGWLSRWKSRRQIKFKRAHGEKSGADVEGAEEWKSTVLPKLLREFELDNIYVNETGLHYRASPDGSLCYACQEFSGSKKAMDRVMILCCVSMSGRGKVNWYEPQCFQGVNVSTLPVTYWANKNARMNGDLFREWLSKSDAALARKIRNILLLVENCVAHPCVDKLKHIRL